MTLNELLDLARRTDRARDLAVAVLDLLSESAPCGLEAPEVIRYRGHGTVDVIRIPASWAADVEAGDARAMARMLFVAADSEEGESK